jgi:hypothetical protein
MRWSVLAALLSCAAAAQTQVRLDHWSEPSQCPDAATLQRAVAERLGRDPFSSAAPRRISVRFTGKPGAFKAEVKVLDETGAQKGQRTLQSSAMDCSELAASVALAIALIIDPLLVTKPEADAAPLEVPPPPPAADEQPPPAPPPPPPTAQLEAPRPPPPTERTLTLLLGAGLGGTLFLVPTPSGTLGLLGSLGGERWEAGLRVAVGTPGSTSVGQTGVSVMVMDASPYGCLKWKWLGGCGVARLGLQLAWASGAPTATQGIAPELGLGLGPMFDLPITQALRLRLHGGAQLNLALASLLVGGFEAYRTTPISIWLGIDVLFRAMGSS